MLVDGWWFRFGGWGDWEVLGPMISVKCLVNSEHIV